MLSKFRQVNLQERDLCEGLDVDGRTILEWIIKELMLKIEFTLFRDNWKAFMNASVENSRFSNL